jgi:D-amino-acid dehydrogenase
VEFNRRAEGLIYFFRDGDNLTRAAAASQFMESAGVRIEHVDGARVAALLGGAGKDDIAGGLFAPDDESGDARLFTLALVERCREAGAGIRLGTSVDQLIVEGGRVVAAQTSGGRIEADAFVVCLGVFSRALLRPLLRPYDLDLPIYPVKGYSATFPVRSDDSPPPIGGVDIDRGLAFAPFGARLRMTRTLHFDGYRTSFRPADFRKLYAMARLTFPTGADYGQPACWAGLRPMTPTGIPIIDRTPIDGLWLNAGQGNFGWTMAAGSARLLADLLGTGKTALPRTGLALAAE